MAGAHQRINNYITVTKLTVTRERIHTRALGAPWGGSNQRGGKKKKKYHRGGKEDRRRAAAARLRIYPPTILPFVAPRIALLIFREGEPKRFSPLPLSRSKTFRGKETWTDSKKRGGGGFALERVESRTLDSFGYPFRSRLLALAA